MKLFTRESNIKLRKKWRSFFYHKGYDIGGISNIFIITIIKINFNFFSRHI